jgi:hypothetical protein
MLGCTSWRVAFVAFDDKARDRLARAFGDAGVDEGLFFFGSLASVRASFIDDVGWLALRTGADGVTRGVRLSPFAAVRAARANRSHGDVDGNARNDAAFGAGRES